MRKPNARGLRRRVSQGLDFGASLFALPPEPVVDTSPPSDFDRWLARRSHRLSASLPPHWLTQVSTEQDHAKIATLAHVYYPDLLPDIISELSAIPVAFDLIITNATGAHLDVHTDELTNLNRLTVLDVENRGRDILPLVAVVNADLLEPYELVLKVHTKKSAWREEHAELGGDGQGWRQDFLDGLLGSANNVTNILNTFASDPRAGLITTAGNIVGPEFWGGDEDIARNLLRRIQLDLTPASLRFASGSMYWVRGFLLQGLRAFALEDADFEDEAGQVDGTTAHALERILGIVTREAGYELREVTSRADAAPALSAWERYAADHVSQPRARVIPFYLPQFHSFPENDAWWGKGFTEWSNVAAAKPVFRGHNQPFLPSDLGFYDVLGDGVREAQYALADSAGIEGFMYYYYWFAGKKLMDTPVEAVGDSDSDEKFCIMWANENWTRRWDGSEREILVAQDYDEVPATQFIHDAMPLLTDERYIRINNKPVLAVYRITQIPDYTDVLDYWQETAKKAGLDGLTLVTVDVGTSMDGVEGDLPEHGMDAFLEFAPHNMSWVAQDREPLTVDHRFEGNILSYAALVNSSELIMRDELDDNRYPGVMVNFDNTARRQWQPDLWYGSNPYTFRRWLNSALSSVATRDRDHRVVFINAWNEWAEGAVLEPSQRFGRTYLLAVRDALFR